MKVSRRKSLALVGGGVVLAATAGTAAFLSTRTPHKALKAWNAAGDYQDPRLYALSYALLAPNPHNLQPWRAELVGDNEINIYRDMSLALPETDPFSRQLTVGMGCFLELLSMAAAGRGLKTELSLFPDKTEELVARVKLTSGADADPLFAQALKRRSCKEPFEDRRLSGSQINEIESFAGVIHSEKDAAEIKKITLDAYHIEMNHHATLKESVDYMRMGKAEIEANPNGIDMGGAFLESLMAVGILSKEALLDPQSKAFHEGIKMYDQMLSATTAYVFVLSDRNERADQIEAGRNWMRLNLKTTEMGLSLHPVSQSLQEFPEMDEQYQAIHKRLASPGQTVQMLGRIGFGPTVPRSPRWPLEARMMDGSAGAK
ncbi:twin-arginine translocation pathway signal protein [Alphaproteobacteria bacterium]|jgi:hypothetical protein|nr:twin-arginine translocation pathway signal protein [Alphaproteobacteria bacterium]